MSRRPLAVFTKHFRGLDVDGLIAVLKDAGARGADLCVRPGHPVEPGTAPATLPDAARRFRRAGLAIPLVTLPTGFTDPRNPGAAPVFAACGRAGVKFLKLGYWSPRNGYRAAVARARRDLAGFARLARKHRVTALVHTHSGAHLGLHAIAAAELVRGFDPREVAVYADTGHLALCGEPLGMAFDVLGPHLAAVAVKDLDRVRRGRGWRERVVPLGRGFVDWTGFEAAMRRARLRGPVVVHAEYEGLPFPALRRRVAGDVAFLRARLKARGVLR